MQVGLTLRRSGNHFHCYVIPREHVWTRVVHTWWNVWPHVWSGFPCPFFFSLPHSRRSIHPLLCLLSGRYRAVFHRCSRCFVSSLASAVSLVDDGAAVVVLAVPGRGLQGPALSQALHVPEPLSVAGHPLLQDRAAVRALGHRPAHSGAATAGKLHHR